MWRRAGGKVVIAEGGGGREGAVGGWGEGCGCGGGVWWVEGLKVEGSYSPSSSSSSGFWGGCWKGGVGWGGAYAASVARMAARFGGGSVEAIAWAFGVFFGGCVIVCVLCSRVFEGSQLMGLVGKKQKVVNGGWKMSSLGVEENDERSNCKCKHNALHAKGKA